MLRYIPKKLEPHLPRVFCFSASHMYLLAASLFSVTPAIASDSSSAQSERYLEEIVVMATRQESPAQSTPLAMTVLNAENRDQLGLRSIQQIAAFTPGVSYQSSPDQLTIRGIGRLDNALGSDPGVATYYDGAYTANTASIGQSSLFIERTEILRGPQGTLFGRNSVGGLVNVISRRPDDEFAIDLQGRLNNYNGQFLAASITGPAFNWGNLRYRLNLRRNQQDGFQKNIGSGRDGNSDEGSEFYELHLALNFSERISVWLKQSHSNTNRLPGIAVLRSPYASAVFQGALVPSSNFGLQDNPAESNNRRASFDHNGHLNVSSDQFVLALSYQLDQIKMKYIGSYGEVDFSNEVDADGTDQSSIIYPLPGPTGDLIPTFEVSTFATAASQEITRTESHEIQLFSTGDQRIQFTGGLYYYKESIAQPFHFRLPFESALRQPFSFATFGPARANPEGDFYYQLGALDARATAAYIQLETTLTPRLNMSFGLRYSEDKKNGKEEQRIVLYNPALNVSGALGIPLPRTLSIDVSANGNGPVTRSLSRKWSALSGKLGFDFQMSDEMLFFGHVTRGYKSGGMRLGQLEGLDLTRANGINPSISPFVDEESVWAYEIGMKSDLLQKTLRLNTSAFFYDYENQQAPLSVRDANDLILQDFINIPESNTYGFEFESIWFATSHLQLIANYGYLNSQVSNELRLIDTDLFVPVEIDVDGNSLPKTPKHKFTLAATYFWDSAIGTVSLSASWSHYAKQYSTFFERELHEIESYTLAGARLTYVSRDDSFRAILGVSNLTDENVPTESLDIGGPNSNFSRIERPIAPRIISLELTKTLGARSP